MTNYDIVVTVSTKRMLCLMKLGFPSSAPTWYTNSSTIADTKSFVSTGKGALAGCCFPKSDSDMSTGDALDMELSSSGQLLGETAKVKPMPKPGILQRCCRIRFRCATHSSMSFLPLLVMKGLSLVPPALLIEVEPARPGLKGARCAPCCHRAAGFGRQTVLHDASRLWMYSFGE